jgi:hypothetical protein
MTLTDALARHLPQMSAARRMLGWLYSHEAIVAELQVASPIRPALSADDASTVAELARSLYARTLDTVDSAKVRSQVMAASSEALRVNDRARDFVERCDHWADIIADPNSDEDEVANARGRVAALLSIARGYTAIAGGIRTAARDGAVAVLPKGVRTDDSPPTAAQIMSAAAASIR